jgi:hypothetical protein
MAKALGAGERKFLLCYLLPVTSETAPCLRRLASGWYNGVAKVADRFAAGHARVHHAPGQMIDWGDAILRCLTPFLAVALVLLVALAAYNTWQINQLRAELAAVKVKIHRPDQQASAERQLNQLLGEAKQRTERARELISGGQVGRARTELGNSLQKLEKASEISKNMAGGAARSVSGAVSSLKSALEGVSKHHDKGKPEDDKSDH